MGDQGVDAVASCVGSDGQVMAVALDDTPKTTMLTGLSRGFGLGLAKECARIEASGCRPVGLR